MHQITMMRDNWDTMPAATFPASKHHCIMHAYSSTFTAVVRYFAVVGPTVWNSLRNDLRDPHLSIASSGRLLKTTHLFQQ